MRMCYLVEGVYEDVFLCQQVELCVVKQGQAVD